MLVEDSYVSVFKVAPHSVTAIDHDTQRGSASHSAALECLVGREGAIEAYDTTARKGLGGSHQLTLRPSYYYYHIKDRVQDSIHIVLCDLKEATRIRNRKAQ